MLKVKMDQELMKINEDHKKVTLKMLGDANLNEVKGLLEYDNSRDIKILTSLGVNSMNNELNNLKGQSMSLEKEETFYNGKLFTILQLKTFCLDYRMKFLQSKYFIGKFDTEIAAKIKNLEKQISKSRTKDQIEKRQTSDTSEIKEIDFQFSDYDLKESFYIMAPLKMFNLASRPKPEKIRNLDPVLFYKDFSGNFLMVHKWGNDFTYLRAVKGYIFKNINNLGIIMTLITISLLSLLLSLFTNVFINSTIFLNIASIFGIISISVILSAIIIPKNDNDFYSENGWNTPFKS